MTDILTWIYVVAAVILLFGAAVFVHEFGHFWMARRRGMKVEAFAIGFGPKVFAWTRDGIEYSFRWIPAGGFVKLPQMITSEALEGGTTKDPVPPAPPAAKILVAFAGPFMNVVFALVIATFIYFAGLPVPVNPPVIGFVEPGSREYKLGIREGDRIVQIEGRKLKSWQDVFEAAALAQTSIVTVVIERDGVRTTYQLPTTTDNPLELKMLNLDSQEHVIVGDVSPKSPAADAELKAGDEIVSFAGVTIFGKQQLIELVGKRGGQPTEIVVMRAGERLKRTVTPRILDAGAKKARIGISFAHTPTKYEVQRPGPLPWDQVIEVWQKTINTLNALLHSKQTGVGLDDLSGPPGILVMLASQVATDYRLALSFMVLLNVNLAVINLLPIPVLDGGHILIAIIEKVRRRPLNMRVLEWTTTAFAVLLISLMIYVSFNDLWRRGRLFKSLFQRDAEIGEQQKTPPAQAPTPAK
jgi:regulator of sigma E protease